MSGSQQTWNPNNMGDGLKDNVLWLTPLTSKPKDIIFVLKFTTYKIFLAKKELRCVSLWLKLIKYL